MMSKINYIFPLILIFPLEAAATTVVSTSTVLTSAHSAQRTYKDDVAPFAKYELAVQDNFLGNNFSGSHWFQGFDGPNSFGFEYVGEDRQNNGELQIWGDVCSRDGSHKYCVGRMLTQAAMREGWYVEWSETDATKPGFGQSDFFQNHYDGKRTVVGANDFPEGLRLEMDVIQSRCNLGSPPPYGVGAFSCPAGIDTLPWTGEQNGNPYPNGSGAQPYNVTNYPFGWLLAFGQVNDGDTVTLGYASIHKTTLTWKNTVTIPATQIQIGANIGISMDNLFNLLNTSIDANLSGFHWYHDTGTTNIGWQNANRTTTFFAATNSNAIYGINNLIFKQFDDIRQFHTYGLLEDETGFRIYIDRLIWNVIPIPSVNSGAQGTVNAGWPHGLKLLKFSNTAKNSDLYVGSFGQRKIKSVSFWYKDIYCRPSPPATLMFATDGSSGEEPYNYACHYFEPLVGTWRDTRWNMTGFGTIPVGSINNNWSIQTLEFTGIPTIADTITIGQNISHVTTIGFAVVGDSTHIQIGASAALTAAATVTFLNASSDTNIKNYTYAIDPDINTLVNPTAINQGASTFSVSSSAITLNSVNAYIHPDRECTGGTCTVCWKPNILASGTYTVYHWEDYDSKYGLADPAAVPTIIDHSGSHVQTAINQNSGTNGWVSYGNFTFDRQKVSLDCSSGQRFQLDGSGSGHLYAGSVKFMRQ